MKYRSKILSFVSSFRKAAPLGPILLDLRYSSYRLVRWPMTYAPTSVMRFSSLEVVLFRFKSFSSFSCFSWITPLSPMAVPERSSLTSFAIAATRLKVMLFSSIRVYLIDSTVSWVNGGTSFKLLWPDEGELVLRLRCVSDFT